MNVQLSFSSDTNGLTRKIADEQFLHPHVHHHHYHHHQKQLQQERQRNATSKNYNSSTTTTSTDLTHVTGDTTPRRQVQTTRRLPAPPATSFFHRTPTETIPLLRTPTVGDRPPVSEVERKSGRPGQTAPDSFDVSTLPRAKFQTTRATNGEVCQGQTVLSQVTTAARPIQTSSYLPINSLPNRSNSHNPASSASKNVSFLRERVQFFTRNELAAAVAMNKSSGSSSSSHQTTTPSKTNWFRRVLFK